jgi:hypothetical protein
MLICYKFQYQGFLQQTGHLAVGDRTKSSEAVCIFVVGYIEAEPLANEFPRVY